MAWNRPNADAGVRPSKTNGFFRHWGVGIALGAGAVALIVVLVAVFTSAPDEAPGEDSRVSRAIAEAAPSVRRSRLMNPDEAKSPALRKAFEALNEKSVPILVKPTGRAIKLPPPSNYGHGLNTGVDQSISWICETTPGEMPFPLPEIEGEDLKNIVAILISRNEVSDGDDAMTAEMKGRVDDAKREMLAYLKDGGDPNEFLRYYHNCLVQDFELRQEAFSQAGDLAAEDPAVAAMFIDRVNEKFDERGILRLEKSEILGDDE